MRATLRVAVVGAFLFAAVVRVAPTQASPSLNRMLNYQLRLTSAAGVPVADGTQNLKLTIYTASSGGTQLYTACSADGLATGTPTAVVVTFANGTGTTLIGSTGVTCASGSAVAIPADLFNADQAWLGVTVSSDAEMTPRKRIVATAYSLNADRIDDLETSAVGGVNAYVPVTDSSGNLTLSANVTVDTNTFFVDSANNRVGVGTTSPATLVSLRRSANDALTGIDIENSNAGASAQARIDIGADLSTNRYGSVIYFNNTDKLDWSAAGAGGLNVQASNAAGVLTFATGGANERMRITSTGNVGIGVTDARDRLTLADGSNLLIDAGNVVTPNGGLGRAENRLTYSEQLDHANWTKVGTTISANAVIGPDGGTTSADQLIAGGAATDHVRQRSAASAVSTTFTGSIWMRVLASSNTVNIRVDARDCSTDALVASGTNRTVTVLPNWQRFSVTQAFGAIAASCATFVVENGTVGTIRAWGAQLEQSSVTSAYAYTETTAFGGSTYGIVAAGAGPHLITKGKLGVGISGTGAFAPTAHFTVFKDSSVLSNASIASYGLGVSATSASSDGIFMGDFGTLGAGYAALQSFNKSLSINPAGNSVGIGDTTPDFLLDVAGTLGVDGNVTLGDASGDSVTFNAATAPVPNGLTMQRSLSGGTNLLTLADTGSSGGLFMFTDDTSDGSTFEPSLNAVQSGGGGARAGITFNTSLSEDGSDDVVFRFYAQEPGNNPIDAANLMQLEDAGSVLWVVNHAGSFGIGDPTPDALLDVAGTLRADGDVTLGDSTSDSVIFTARVASDVVPQSDDAYDLGVSGLRWRDLYLGPATLHIGSSTTDEGTMSYDTTGNILNIGTDATTNGDIAFFTNDLYLDKSTGNVGVGDSSPEYVFSVDGKAFIDGSTVHGGAGTAMLTVDGDSGTDVVEFRDFNAVSLFVIESDGKIGVGDNTPAALFTVGSGDKFKVNTDGDVTSSFTQLDGTDLANGAGSATTTLVLDDTTGFNAGNYILVNSTYAKIVTVDSGTQLTISPALTWADNATVDEYHVPEIGAINTASTLANRYGRGYFIDGVVAGNGSTYITDNKIESGGALVINGGSNQPVTFGTGTVTIPGALSVTSTGNSTLSGPLRLANIADPDPTGSNGLMYYNTTNNKFRCYQAGAWTDCIGAGGSPSGWTDDGSVVRLSTAADQVGIGTATPASGVSVEIEDATDTDATRELFALHRSRSSATAPGSSSFGGDLAWRLEGFTDNTDVVAAKISGTWGGAQANDTTSRDADLSFWTMTDNVLSERMTIDGFTGYVGIGTNGPNAPIEVRNSGTVTGVYPGGIFGAHDTDSIGANGLGTQIEFQIEDSASVTQAQAAQIQVVWEDATSASRDASIRFVTAQATSLVEAMRIDDGGLVGIGDTSPLATLTVGNGDLFQVAGASGNVTTSGDVAVNGGDITASAALNVSSVGALNLGTNAVSHTVTIGNTTGTTGVTINAATGNIDIGTSANARTVNIANGAALQVVTLGSTSSGSMLTLNTGGSGTLNLVNGTGGITMVTGATSTTNGISYGANGVQTGNAFNVTSSGLTSGAALFINSTNTLSSVTPASGNTFSGTFVQSSIANTAGYNVGSFNLTSNSSIAGNTENILRVQNQVTSNTTDVAVSAGLLIDNADTSAAGSTVITDAIKLTASGGLGTPFTNYFNAPNFSITNAGLITTADDLAVNGGDITTAVATFNLAASATTVNLAGGSGSTGCTIDSSGNFACSGSVGSGGTLQAAYNGSTTPELTLDSTRGGLTIRDASSPIGANLLEIQNNAGGTTYLGVTTTALNLGVDLLPTTAPTVGSQSRTTTTIATGQGPTGSGSDVVVASDTYPVIAYYDQSAGDLKIAKCSSTSCSSGTTHTTVDSTGVVGQMPSIALASDGFPIVSYYDSTNQDLKVLKCGNASCSSGNTITTVDSTGNVGTYSDIALDAGDTFAVISYYDTTNLDLKVLKCGNASCSSGNTITTVDSTGSVGNYTSIAVPASGTPVVSYFDTTNTALKVAQCGNASCSSGNTLSTVDNTGDMGYNTSLAIGSDGFPIISYRDGSIFQSLRVADCTTASCSSGVSLYTRDSSSYVAGDTSIAVPADGLPVITYYSNDYDTSSEYNSMIKCSTSTCSSGTWYSINGSGADSSVTIGSDGFPFISHYNYNWYASTGGTLEALKCGNATCNSGNTNTVLAGYGDTYGNYLDAFMPVDGLPIMSHFDEVNNDLLFTKCGNATCTSGNSTVTLDSTGIVGTYTSIVADSDSLPVISYYDTTNQDLKVIKCGNTTCTSGNTTTTVDSTGAVGTYSSIAIDASDLPVISYHDGTNLDLKVLKCGNLTCTTGNTTTTVHTLNSTGLNTSIAVDSDGIPTISFYYATGADFYVYRCANVSCTSGSAASVDTTGTVGANSSIAIPEDDLPVISYYEGTTNNNLKVVKCGTAACNSGNTVTTVDSSTQDVGAISSIAVRSGGTPIISYQNTTSGDIKVAKCENMSCTSATISTVDSAGTDDFNALVLSSGGWPMVFFHDGTLTGVPTLKVVTCIDSACELSTGTSYTGGKSIGSTANYFTNVYASTFWGKNYRIENFDLAETYRVRDTSITAGDIVRVAPAMSGDPAVEKSTRAYDAAMGVISTQPGLLLTQWDAADDVRPVALKGRVPVKVNNEGGAIRAGDAIAPSSEPGVGMRASKPGRIVGYALDDWSGTSGTVELFVNPGFHDGDAIVADDAGLAIRADVAMTPVAEASAEAVSHSLTFSFRGSAWDADGGLAVTRAISMRNAVTDKDAYRLSFANNAGDEIAFLGQDGDVAIKGRLFPSDRGALQTDKYITYDGTDGLGGNRMRTNANGWGADGRGFAEMIPSDDVLEEGEIAMIDTRNPEKMRRAIGGREDAPAYLLAGIVTAESGYLAGMNEVGSYPIALEGRATARVVGPVKIGDAITVSLTDGVGVVAIDPTYVIGYALEAKESDGPGTVTVFVKTGWWNGSGIESGDAPVSLVAGGALTVTENTVDLGRRVMLAVGAMEGVEGLWSIDGAGQLKAKDVSADKVTAKAVTVRKTDAMQTVGAGSIVAGSFASVITNPAITAQTQVIVTFRTDPGSRWWVDEVHDGSFIVKTAEPVVADAKFTYWIIDVIDETTPPAPQPPVVSPDPPVDPPADTPPTAPDEPPEEGSEDAPPADEPAPIDDPAPLPEPTEEPAP